MLVKILKIRDHIKHLDKAFPNIEKVHDEVDPLKWVFGVASEKFLSYMVNQMGREANPETIKALI